MDAGRTELPKLNTIYHADLFDLCKTMPDESVDMILCDLPYGTTACSWDSIIPIVPMWEQFKRIVKPNSAIVLTATQPFSSLLVTSNMKMFKHEWIWRKENGTNPLNAKIEPMRVHEVVLIFADGKTNYYPVMTKGKPYIEKSGVGLRHNGGHKQIVTINDGNYYPQTVQFFMRDKGIHPTQKPLALFEYLIKTYTLSGQLVFDPCVGSGTTALACQNTGRNFVCGDSSQEYVDMALHRLQVNDPYQATVDKATGIKQLSLFEN